VKGADSLTKDECDGLLLAAGQSGSLAIRDRMLLELMGWTGLRVSELSALRVDQVIDAGLALPTLHLNRSDTKRKKGGKLPLAEKLQGSLESYYFWLRGWYEGDWLFPGYDGKHLTSRAVQLRVKRLATLAAIRKKISPHSLRKFYVQRLLDQGLDVRSVMELSRHSSLASLHCYLVVDEEAARAAVDKI
jgi:site-specific recombinase XerD